MPHEPKLTVYILGLKPNKKAREKTNRWLFRNIIRQANDNPLTDEEIMHGLFREFVAVLDTPSMYSDTVSKKSITLNQNTPDGATNNIRVHSERFIIEGVIEGGAYGRRRNKTSTINKIEKTDIREVDAITDNFYFFIYMPPESTKSVLFVQSYTDDAIDSVMKKFWSNFFTVPTQFNQPSIRRYIPQSIIDDFKTNSTVSNLTFSTDIPGETLLENTSTLQTKNFNVTVKITPTNGDLTHSEYEQTIVPIQQNLFTKLMTLSNFTKKKGTLKDSTTGKVSHFDLGTNFEIQPVVQLSKYITINFDDTDFDRIKAFCFQLLDSVKPEIYLDNAIQER
jgi:hypothetical protein